ncbi:MAG: hypothetical protein A4E49_02795 [Methanosaeta sp. PtaU1.Bin112]|nr:MAG: hypothetical protein A4E49_02795 [Methanosaeta sp. PtaU1.Bin112]
MGWLAQFAGIDDKRKRQLKLFRKRKAVQYVIESCLYICYFVRDAQAFGKSRSICDAVRLYAVLIIHDYGDEAGDNSGVERIAYAICRLEKSVRFVARKSSLACKRSPMGDGVSHLLVKRKDRPL